LHIRDGSVKSGPDVLKTFGLVLWTGPEPYTLTNRQHTAMAGDGRLRGLWTDRLEAVTARLKSSDLSPVDLALAEQEIAIYEQVIHELEAHLNPDEN
jgi:hypothetical protein